MPGFGAGQLELAFEIGESNIDVAHGHCRIDVAKQLHQDGEADTRAKHLSGVRVSELMGDDSYGKSERVANLMKVVAELNQDSHFASRSRQKPFHRQVEDRESGRSVAGAQDRGRRRPQGPCARS